MSLFAALLIFILAFMLGNSASFGSLENTKHSPQHNISSIRRLKRSLATESQSADSQCNSRQLEKIMHQNIVYGDVIRSKLNIMRMAKKQIGGTFNVICARGNFSYITSTRIYCLVEKRGVKCFSFLSESSRKKPLI